MKEIRLILSVLAAFMLLTFVFSSCNKDEEPEEPDVSFDFTNNYHKAPIEVEFTNTSQANDFTISSWEWDFGDGTTSTVESPTHEFTEPFYNKKITVKGYYDGEEYRTGYGYITVYGDITGWTPDDIDFYKDAWAGEELPVKAYLVVRDAQGNIHHYSDNENFIIWTLDEDENSVGISLDDYGTQSLSGGQITFELLEYGGGDVVYPESDREIYSITIEGSDFTPEDDAGPYNPIYNPSDPISLGIDWIED
ncbi:MAG: PKD domain-containing protein [Bacteroidota bacterium]